jgi:hypothetical protein
MIHASDADLLIVSATRRFNNTLVLRNCRLVAEDGA